MMALAMEKWNLQKRIALKRLVLIGVSPGRILLVEKSDLISFGTGEVLVKINLSG